LTSSSDAAATLLTNAFWYINIGDMLPCDPSVAEASNKNFVTWWNLTKQSGLIEMYGKIHSDLCNVPQYLLPGVRVRIKFSKAISDLCLMNKDVEPEI
jgi:hypothetical protein